MSRGADSRSEKAPGAAADVAESSIDVLTVQKYVNYAVLTIQKYANFTSLTVQKYANFTSLTVQKYAFLLKIHKKRLIMAREVLMLRRKAYENLIDWKKTKEHETLLIKGARQIGKTFLVREFGKNEYKSFIEINFLKNPDLKAIFDG